MQNLIRIIIYIIRRWLLPPTTSRFKIIYIKRWLAIITIIVVCKNRSIIYRTIHQLGFEFLRDFVFIIKYLYFKLRSIDTLYVIFTVTQLVIEVSSYTTKIILFSILCHILLSCLKRLYEICFDDKQEFNQEILNEMRRIVDKTLERDARLVYKGVKYLTKMLKDLGRIIRIISKIAISVAKGCVLVEIIETSGRTTTSRSKGQEVHESIEELLLPYAIDIAAEFYIHSAPELVREQERRNIRVIEHVVPKYDYIHSDMKGNSLLWGIREMFTHAFLAPYNRMRKQGQAMMGIEEFDIIGFANNPPTLAYIKEHPETQNLITKVAANSAWYEFFIDGRNTIVRKIFRMLGTLLKKIIEKVTDLINRFTGGASADGKASENYYIFDAYGELLSIDKNLGSCLYIVDHMSIVFSLIVIIVRFITILIDSDSEKRHASFYL